MSVLAGLTIPYATVSLNSTLGRANVTLSGAKVLQISNKKFSVEAGSFSLEQM
jgi:hypothetical protein